MTPADRIGLRYRIEAAIEGFRDQDEPPLRKPGIVHLYDPDEVKELARAIRDALVKDWLAD